LSKFYPRKDGHGYISTYDAHLPKSKLKFAGFLNEDGTTKEYIARVENRTIILEHKEDLYKKD